MTSAPQRHLNVNIKHIHFNFKIFFIHTTKVSECYFKVFCFYLCYFIKIFAPLRYLNIIIVHIQFLNTKIFFIHTTKVSECYSQSILFLGANNIILISTSLFGPQHLKQSKLILKVGYQTYVHLQFKAWDSDIFTHT